MPTDLTCKEMVELMTDYFEEKLSAQERQRFESHLAKCKGCQAYLDQMRRTITFMGKLSEKDVDPETEQEFLQVFRNWKAK